MMEFMICKQLIDPTVTMAIWLIASECTLCHWDKAKIYNIVSLWFIRPISNVIPSFA